MSPRITRGDLLRVLASPAAVSACVALPSRPESVRQARHFVSDQLDTWGCESLTDPTVTICSELAANAVTHAEPNAAGTGEILVSLTLVAGEALIAQVADSGPHLPKITQPRDLAESGRGLSIVTELSDYWSASPRSDGQGKTVSAYLLHHPATLDSGTPSATGRTLPLPADLEGVRSEAAAEGVIPASPGGTELHRLDFSRPTVARVCDYLSGSTDNYPADRALGRQLLAVAPWLDRAATAARAHGQEAVRLLVTEGVVQLLDLGCGLPRRRGHNVHEAAQDIQREARVVYVDRDPMVQAHVRMVFEETPRDMGLHADITLTEEMLSQPVIARLDRDRPMAVLLHEVLPWIGDAGAQQLLSTLRSWLPACSVLSVVHAAADSHPTSSLDLVALYQGAGILYRPRTLEQLLALADGWVVEGPGVTAVPLRGLRIADGREPLYGSYAFTARTPKAMGNQIGPAAPSHTPVTAGGSCRGGRPMTAPYSVRALASTDYSQAGVLLSRRWAHEVERGRPVDQARDTAVIRPLRTDDHSHELHGLFEDGQLAAMWRLDSTGPGPGWSTCELAESSIRVLLVYTDPGHRSVGRLVSLWLADHFAHVSRPPVWLRCSTPNGRLADHFTGTWGWQQVRQEGGFHLPQLSPELKPHLNLLVARRDATAAADGITCPPALARTDHS
ncbi:SAM-dependent methyltransferase [Streptomyces sp. NPDC051704]|uniref:SAM-dependent methyltransferase n=1 Tax=Streptomyces sp. NPDC051704 TaxID=3365671 RepID=UPI0037B7E2D8